MAKASEKVFHVVARAGSDTRPGVAEFYEEESGYWYSSLRYATPYRSAETARAAATKLADRERYALFVMSCSRVEPAPKHDEDGDDCPATPIRRRAHHA